MKFYLLVCVALLVSLAGLQAEPLGLQIYPKDPTMLAGRMIDFTAVAHNRHNTVFTPSNIVWYATGGTIDQRGRYHAGQNPGSYTITAICGVHRAMTNVIIKVLAPEIVRVDISVPQVNLIIGQGHQFTAVAYDSFNRPVSFVPQWRVTGGGTIDHRGYFTAMHAGRYTVTATAPNTNAFGSAVIVIGAMPVVVRMVINPPSARIQAGQTAYFTATAYNSHNQPVGCNPVWGSDAGGIIQNNGAYSAGMTPGYYRIWASDQNTGIRAEASVQIIGHHQPPIPPPIPTDGRIVITKFESGGGNFLSPKVKATLEVYGSAIQTVKIYGVSSSGHFNELDAASCANGQTINFNSKYDRFNTKYFEIRLYNNMGQVVARTTKDAQ